MLGGCATILALYVAGYLVHQRWNDYLLLGLHPFLWSMVVFLRRRSKPRSRAKLGQFIEMRRKNLIYA